MNRPTIRPFAEVCGLSQRALDAIGFRFTRILLLKDSHGWLNLVVDWTADGNVKYPMDAGHGSAMSWHYHAETLRLSFPHVPAPYYGIEPPRAFQPDHLGEKHVAHIEVGIKVARDPRRHARARKSIRLDYSYAYHDNTKWGVCVYYRPIDWWRGKDKTLFEWEARRRKDGTLV